MNILILISLTFTLSVIVNPVVRNHIDDVSKSEMEVIVQFQPFDQETEDVEDLISKLQSTNNHSLSQLRGLQYKYRSSIMYWKPYYISNSLALKTNSTHMLNELINDYSHCVVELSSNALGRMNAMSVHADGMMEIPWNADKMQQVGLKQIESDNLSPSIYAKLSGLRYGNADTGVDFSHPSLLQNYQGFDKTGRVDHNYSWFDATKRLANPTKPNLVCGINSLKPCDDAGHGTHTMSTVVGSGNIGVANQTRWIACKNMDQDVGSPETYLSCLQFLLSPTRLDGTNPRVEKRPHVISNSWGCDPDEGCSAGTFGIVLQSLRRAGIFVITSAGNSGQGGCSTITTPPATNSLTFNVGALTTLTSKSAPFSSKGPVPTRRGVAVDLMAPGTDIVGAIPRSKYALISGTSMAAPHVAGVALLVMAACPHLIRDVVKLEKVLHKSAIKLYSSMNCGRDSKSMSPNNEYGYGIVNAKRAIQMCSGRVNATTPSGRYKVMKN